MMMNIKNINIYLWFSLIYLTSHYIVVQSNPLNQTLGTYPMLSKLFQKRCNCTTQTVFFGRQFCRDELIFEDNFDSLNLHIWKKDLRIPLDTKDAEFVSYQSYVENCYVENGKLIIYPKLLTDYPEFDENRLRTGVLNINPCTGIDDRECNRRAEFMKVLPPIVSCKLNTKTSFTFKYGKIEIRAKFPKGDWIIPEIHLEPVHDNSSNGNSYASGQMRIGFIRGNQLLESNDYVQLDGNILSGGLILSNDQQFRDNWMRTTMCTEHFGENFHNYTLTWTKDLITVAVDGHFYGRFSNEFQRQANMKNIKLNLGIDNGPSMTPFDKEFYLSFGVTVGGFADFPDLSHTGELQTMKPWNNTDPKSELNFFLDRHNWYETWKGIDAAMQIDYVKVWAV